MQACEIRRNGGPENLVLCERETPQPGAGEVAIAVAYAGINFADILARQGLYPGAPPTPSVVGYEVSGRVSAVGEGVDPAWLGREVLALTNFGGYAQTAVVGVDYLWPLPPGLALDVAAAIPLNYITAAGLLAMGGLAAGDTLLIHNVGGGVGLAALELAQQRGAQVLGTASGGKHALLRERGLAEPIDYRREDFVAAVRQRTGGTGVDLVLDPIGGAHWKRSLAVLRPSGRLGMYGISGASAPGLRGKLGLARLFAQAPWFHPARLIPGNRGVYGINIHAMYEQATLFRRWMAPVLEGVAAGRLQPRVDRVFALAEAGEAHAYIEARRNVGKVLLRVDPPAAAQSPPAAGTAPAAT